MRRRGRSGNETQPDQGAWKWLTLFSTLAVTAATVSMTFVSTCQWRSMAEMNELTREGNRISLLAMESSQRAWISISSIKSIHTGEGKKTPAVYFTLKNSGSSPGSAVILSSKFVYAKRPLETEEDVLIDGVPVLSRSLLLPNSEMFSAKDIPGLTDERLAQLKAGTILLHVLGRVVYQDGVGHERESRFCAYRQESDGDWASCPVGNWAR